jgi:para-nitrobenzyl esterase
VTVLAGPVRVDGGLISGVPLSQPPHAAFLGIPFAAAPTGELRWRPPQPVEAWNGVRNADSLPRQCVQAARREDSVYAEFAGRRDSGEDCLYLNLWTPAHSVDEKLPVMVWIHGGAFQQGSGANPVFVRGDLTKKRVVLVTFNYRLGVFGFLAHEELARESAHGVCGNYGLLDQVAALQWVQRNIEKFGGDPANVTVFGQSAGAASVIDLIASQRTRGLFSKAIAQSFGVMDMSLRGEAEARGKAFADKLGAKSLAALRALAPETLLKEAVAARPPFFPIADGWLIAEPVKSIFAGGRQQSVPLLIGWNRDEGTTFGHATSVAEFEARLEARFGSQVEAAKAHYRADNLARAKHSSMVLTGDDLFGADALSAAQGQARVAPVFAYHFERAQPFAAEQEFAELAPASALGAFHSSEYPYVFGTLDVLTRPWTAEDRLLSATMQSYWTNFARSGDPNGPGLPAWPRFSDERDSVLHLDIESRVGPVPDRDRLKFVQRLKALPAGD